MKEIIEFARSSQQYLKSLESLYRLGEADCLWDSTNSQRKRRFAEKKYRHRIYLKRFEHGWWNYLIGASEANPAGARPRPPKRGIGTVDYPQIANRAMPASFSFSIFLFYLAWCNRHPVASNNLFHDLYVPSISPSCSCLSPILPILPLQSDPLQHALHALFHLRTTARQRK